MSSDSIRTNLLLNLRQHAKKAAAWNHAAETWQPLMGYLVKNSYGSAMVEDINYLEYRISLSGNERYER
jgi:hypothetical protein